MAHVQGKITPAKFKENSGYLNSNIGAIYLRSSKGDTESTEFEMQEEQNASTRIHQSLPPRLWKSLVHVRPVATKEKSWLWFRRTHQGSEAHPLVTSGVAAQVRLSPSLGARSRGQPKLTKTGFDPWPRGTLWARAPATDNAHFNGVPRGMPSWTRTAAAYHAEDKSVVTISWFGYIHTNSLLIRAD